MCLGRFACFLSWFCINTCMLVFPLDHSLPIIEEIWKHAALPSVVISSSQDFLCWLASSRRLAAALVVPPPDPVTPFFPSAECISQSGGGRLSSAREESNHAERANTSPTFCSFFLAFFSVFFCVWQRYRRVGSKSQGKCMVSMCLCGCESGRKKGEHCVNSHLLSGTSSCIIRCLFRPNLHDLQFLTAP